MGYILAFLFIGFFCILICAAFREFLRRASIQLPEAVPDPEPEVKSDGDWIQLCDRAQKVVDEIIAGLPHEVAAEAKCIPCLFEEKADPSVQGKRRGRIHGVYRHFTMGKRSAWKGPIVLYLRSIQETAGERNWDFNQQVRYTFLHELGHHFGWDEMDLARHGLPSGGTFKRD